MIISKLLMAKKIFTSTAGDIIADLVSATFRFGKSPISAGPVIVKAEEAMRPDLLSNRIYADQDNWDSLLKYNGVSNPFSLEEGELLLAPAFKSLSELVGPPIEVFEKGTEPAKNNESAVITPKTAKDAKRLDSIRTKTGEIVPPNVNLSGVKNVKVENGVVIFGGDITQSSATTSNSTVNRSRVQDQLKNTNPL
jgi:hypothetical protein